MPRSAILNDALVDSVARLFMRNIPHGRYSRPHMRVLAREVARRIVKRKQGRWMLLYMGGAITLTDLMRATGRSRESALAWVAIHQGRIDRWANRITPAEPKATPS